MFDDLLSALEPDRRAHSVEVGRKAGRNAHLVAPHLRSELVVAATLHDIGYGHRLTGFHSLDGATFLLGLGFSRLVCHLVAHHSASTVEAQVRGIALTEFDTFAVDDQQLAAAHAVLWWADMTTGPTGRSVTVEERLAEIESRYGSSGPVQDFIDQARGVLLAAGQSPAGSATGTISSFTAASTATFLPDTPGSSNKASAGR